MVQCTKSSQDNGFSFYSWLKCENCGKNHCLWLILLFWGGRRAIYFHKTYIPLCNLFSCDSYRMNRQKMNRALLRQDVKRQGIKKSQDNNWLLYKMWQVEAQESMIFEGLMHCSLGHWSKYALFYITRQRFVDKCFLLWITSVDNRYITVQHCIDNCFLLQIAFC